ncbi:MAG TPA: hypothetical protein DCS88_07155 [Alphaproteobacteria bacterium]|nr:hypothetical protein [Alphaproteobacteria bacterium]
MMFWFHDLKLLAVPLTSAKADFRSNIGKTIPTVILVACAANVNSPIEFFHVAKPPLILGTPSV